MSKKLQKASHYRLVRRDAEILDSTKFHQQVEEFLDGPLREAIEKSPTNNVNVPIPSWAYSKMTEFYAECHDRLDGMGFESNKSHDDSNRNDTLYVRW